MSTPPSRPLFTAERAELVLSLSDGETLRVPVRDVSVDYDTGDVKLVNPNPVEVRIPAGMRVVGCVIVPADAISIVTAPPIYLGPEV